ncbi:cadherin domain-containing protein, partial [Ignatzschineria cameli]|uniref:cadherin domain-containing protein n=1 Tax=Ignatzschineria cameli TaxID=2182793 RepID=UPI000D6058B8
HRAVPSTAGTFTDTAEITVKVNNLNDNAPEIEDATVTFDENIASGTKIYDVNDNLTGSDLDLDGDQITYTITAGNEEGIFEIDPNTGVITIAEGKTLDYETLPTHQLTVTATDGTFTDTAEITVKVNNLNDNAPEIEDATVTFDENIASGTKIYDVNDNLTGSDLDLDGDQITYTITAGNEEGIFEIDPDTGVITIAEGKTLDYETLPTHQLTVTATDGTFTDTAEITVKVNNLNDNAPEIEDATVTFDENIASGTKIYDVNDNLTGSDLDLDGDQITYTITAGNEEGIFEIDPDTGVITIAEGKTLDYETLPTHQLTVTATDGTFTDTAEITVKVNNLNDNAPEIEDATVTFDENIASGTKIYDVNDNLTGSDLDLDGDQITYTITAGNEEGIFEIDPNTGVITIAEGKTLDYETLPTHQLTVTATDGTFTDTAEITVKVNNLNDNAPEIEDATVTFDENIASGTKIYDVNDNLTGSDLDLDGDQIN